MVISTESTMDKISLRPESQQATNFVNLASDLFKKTGMPVVPIGPNGHVYFPEKDRHSLGDTNSIQEQAEGNAANGQTATRSTTTAQAIDPTSEQFRVIQKWEGKVLEVENDLFVAELKTIKGEEGTLIAEIYLEEVDESDLPLLKPGAIFYWSIGYYKKPSGTMRVSLIRFRRLPPWNQRQLQKAREQAGKMQSLFDDL